MLLSGRIVDTCLHDGHIFGCTKTTELILSPFWTADSYVPKESFIRWCPDPPREWILSREAHVPARCNVSAVRIVRLPSARGGRDHSLQDVYDPDDGKVGCAAAMRPFAKFTLNVCYIVRRNSTASV